MDKKNNEIINKVRRLVTAYKQGELGGAFMPEDSNPGLNKGCEINYLYFTLPMALNYQRNSYVLWKSAKSTYEDVEARNVFYPKKVIEMSDDILRYNLTKYKIALQKNKQPLIWRKICETLLEYFNGDVRELLKECEYDVKRILDLVQVKYKKKFPYLSGNKICNYWLYVLNHYTDANLHNKKELNIAPDTHVIQSSIKLGILNLDNIPKSQIQKLTIMKWAELLKNTEFIPIDIHTPLWLWSKGGFVDLWRGK